MRPSDLVFVGIAGETLDRATAALLAEHQPGGIVLFGRNIAGPEQFLELVTELRRILPEAVFAIDAEGGRVDRLRDVVAPAPAGELLARNPPQIAYQAGRWIGQALRLFDLDMDFAPVVDLDRGERDNSLNGRYLGARPAEVIERARAFLRGLHAGGVGGCVKHFPGLGGAGEDTHLRGSAVYLPASELQDDLEPFATLAPLAGAVMVSHGIYPAYDGEQRPATLSPPILGGLLRGRLGFEGLAFSDDLEMEALAPWGDLAERSQASFAAGCDALPICHHCEVLPEVVARLDDPGLASRRMEAYARLDRYRQRLRTLHEAQEHAVSMRPSRGSHRLDEIRQRLEELGEIARRVETA
ncbi:MAG TPA: beta-N-acetylhexosaminidase [Thermoanaerobaculia bacterium]|nr:beta-N-acetylhexosaminidase [Thermoanaerobaculia bacterium]